MNGLLARVLTSVGIGGMLLVGQPAPMAAQALNGCRPGEVPRYSAGFADLHAYLGTTVGEPVTCEFADPKGTGDVEQQTTQGLAFWRKRTNTPTFTNGFEHWAHTAAGWVYWTGSDIDPPSTMAEPAAPAAVEVSCVPGHVGGVLADICLQGSSGAIAWTTDHQAILATHLGT